MQLSVAIGFNEEISKKKKAFCDLYNITQHEHGEWHSQLLWSGWELRKRFSEKS